MGESHHEMITVDIGQTVLPEEGLLRTLKMLSSVSSACGGSLNASENSQLCEQKLVCETISLLPADPGYYVFECPCKEEGHRRETYEQTADGLRLIKREIM